LLEYLFRFMISKEARAEFLASKGINVRLTGLSYEKAARKLREETGFTITLSDVNAFNRDFRICSAILFNKWENIATDLHLENLKSGLLDGHDWHGAMPSFLHLSLQNKVREVCGGGLSLSDAIDIGKDIMKQEYFIVATHDLCESKIIDEINDVIPSLANKGVSDFVFKEIPYDLKNSGVPNGWTFENAKSNPRDFALSLYQGADSERMRKQAEKSINNWGLNRFYVIVKDLNKWLTEPEKILASVISKTNSLGTPIQITVNGISLSCQMVFVD